MHAEKVCHEWLSTVLPDMHRKRTMALSAVVGSALRGGRLNVTSLGRSIGTNARTKHNIKRADRLLSNKNLQAELFSVYRHLARKLIGVEDRPTILVDWSDIDPGQKFFLLRAALAEKGRALTIYEEVHARHTAEKRRTHACFLSNLKEILPPNCKPTIVTDAGFRGPWFKMVLAQEWHFIGRVRNRDKAQISNNMPWIGAKELYEQATNVPKRFSDISLCRSNPLVCSLVLFKRKPKGRRHLTKMKREARAIRSLKNATRAKEPWLLATSLSSEAAEIVTIYSRRMQIEEAFRDLKCARLGLGLCHNGTYKHGRMKVLVLVGSIATIFASLLGATARRLHLHRQFQANTSYATNVLSNVFVGIQLFRRFHLRHGVHWPSLRAPRSLWSAATT